jgi:hypothetical protein
MLFTVSTGRGLGTSARDRADFESRADAAQAGARETPLLIGSAAAYTNLDEALETRAHVAVWASTVLRTIDSESALALRDQGGSYRLASIRLYRRSFEREIAALAAMSAFVDP